MTGGPIEHGGTVWLIDNNNPEPLLRHSVRKLVGRGIPESAIRVTDAPEGVRVGELVVKIWPHHLEVGRVRTIRNDSFISGSVETIDLETDADGAYVG